MNFERGILSLSNSILIDVTLEEDDGFIVTYSYYFHVTMIFNSLGHVGLIGKFLWKNIKLPHSRHLLPPTFLLLKKHLQYSFGIISLKQNHALW